jgi:hypothetical protein
MKEIWKDIKGYEGLYQVSNLGGVKRIERYNIKKCRYGNYCKLLLKEKIIFGCLDKNGYYKTSLSKNKIKKTFRINRLVAQTFLDNPENKPQVNHKDGNKLNNNITNLENISHAIKNNLIKVKGNDNPNSKLKEKDVIEIKQYLRDGKSNKEIATIFNISNQMISNIKLGYNWSYVNV